MKHRLSQKIAGMLTLFTFAGMLIFSVLTVGLLKNALVNRKAENLRNAATLIEKIITQNRNTPELINATLRAEGLPFYILFTIYRIQKNTTNTLNANDREQVDILVTNDPFLPILPQSKKPERYIEKNFFADGDLNILYMTTQNESWHIQTAMYMDTDSLDELAHNLPLILAQISLPLLLLSFFAARFFTARMLRPVQLINRTANEISSQNLNRRIPENGTGDELEELARTFNGLFTRLQADFERERRFVSDISHELKTPVAVLQGHLNLLRRWGINEPDIAEKSLKTALLEVTTMQTLIENMLLLSRSENAPPAKTEPIQITPFLLRLAENTQLVYPQIIFSLPEDKTIRLQTNEVILSQVLRILIDNSIKHSPQPAHIEFILRNKNGRIQLGVRDQGNGIAAKDLPHIFERLYRADESRNRKTGGSGLGLAIARSMLSLIHASISAQSPTLQTDGSYCGTEMTIEFLP